MCCYTTYSNKLCDHAYDDKQGISLNHLVHYQFSSYGSILSNK